MFHLALTLLLQSATPNQQILSTTPYNLDPWPHLAATGSMLLFVGIGEVAVKPALLGGLNCRLNPAQNSCDAAVLNPWDRTVVGNQSTAWRRSSDVLVMTAFAAPLIADAIDTWQSGSDTPGYDWGIDTLVLAESVAVATFVGDIFKFAVRRPRPTLYIPGPRSVENQLSFPSGHSASTAAAAGAYAMTFALRHPDSPWRWGVLGIGGAVSLVTAYARVAGGMHFYTDVVAGLILGATCGFIIPYAHQVHMTPVVSIDHSTPEAASTLGLQLAY